MQAPPTPAPVEAVCALLPGPSPADVAAAKALARSGPPREQVGLELAPFALRTGGRTADDALDVTLLWGVLPYVMVAVLVGGTIWRYRYDKFGWTTRSSELYESRLLRIGSPLFHFGLLVVIVGHVIGLIIPKSWTDAVGLSQEAYHVQALLLGAIAGFSTLVGVGILIYRRRTTGPVFMRHHPQRQADVRRARRRDRRRAGHHPARRRGRRGAQLPAHRLAVVPVAVRPPARHRGDGRPVCAFQLHTLIGMAAVRDLAVHPARARLHRARAATCSGPTSSTAPAPADRRAAGAPRLGAGRQPLGGRR